MLTDERYKQLMEGVGLPNSRSLLQALKQCAMEAVLSERAVIKKLGEQEPAWYKELGAMEIEHPSRYRKLVDVGSISGLDYEPLYAHPLPAQAVPEGWQLVPIEPTKEMCDAYCEGSIAPVGNLSRYGYKAMLSAAQKP